MSPVQESVMCTTDYPRPRIGAASSAALVRAEFLPPADAFYSGPFLEEGDAEMRKRAECVSQYKLPTYQAAAVVVHTARIPFPPMIRHLPAFFLATQSTVLAGIESQLLVFFKSSPDFTREPVPVILQYLLVLTYIALIFSVSATISSLVLTRNFGNVPMLVGRLQEKTRSMPMSPFESPSLRTRSGDDIIPRRWRVLEGHCMYQRIAGTVRVPNLFFYFI